MQIEQLAWIPPGQPGPGAAWTARWARGWWSIGFYGPRLRVGSGSVDGWDPFGPERVITPSGGNVPYELGGGAVLAGFYSYGEISPFSATTRCELHNQTMTVTTCAEAE